MVLFLSITISVRIVFVSITNIKTTTNNCLIECVFLHIFKLDFNYSAAAEDKIEGICTPHVIFRYGSQ